GPGIDLDRDRSQGRTPVQQCWDYLNEAPECPWGIVSNIVSFRLYRRELGSACCQVFTLKELKVPEKFREFYYLFERGGLLPTLPGQTPRADALLEKTAQRQREVGDELYDSYHGSRVALVQHLCGDPHNKPLEKAIYIAQRLLDRIVFLAFCQDRGLLPPKTIAKAYNSLPPFYRVTNPRWQNFLDLFRVVDKGDPKHQISPFNGGLFRADGEVDDLQLEDEWTDFFREIGTYDFRDEVNVDVLGHLFERSINDLERLRLGGFFQTSQEKTGPKMPKSAERKKLGTYYTPPDFTRFIVFNTVGKILSERFETKARESGLTAADLAADKPDPRNAAYWRACLDILRGLKVLDPACGSGAFLIQAFDLLEVTYRHVIDHIAFHEGPKAEALRDEIPDFILHDNLFGVDLAPEAVEITQLALWISSARTGRTLADLSANIVCGNSLVADKTVNPRALDWREAFPDVFARPEGPFDCVISNPPWERLKLQEREFFDALAPGIASSVNAATRREKIAQLEKLQPDLHRRYLETKAGAENVLDYVRSCGRFPLTGKGDVNTYAVFAELARTLVAPAGAAGLLVPSGIATDHTTKEFFGELSGSNALFGLYDFENKAPVFPDVHRSFKFSVLLFGGADRKTEAADFFFFARTMEDLDDKSRHIALTAQDM
ncbi:MAG: DNA methyltransferase, partial [Planctomycetota bacterium]